MSPPPDTADADEAADRDTRAGEYVLGTLSGNERLAFEQALAAHASLQASVYAWQDRLLGLARRVAPVEPRSGTWAAIDARLAPPPAANDSQWQRLRRWQWGSAAGLAASLVFAALLVLQLTAPPQVRYIAVLQSPVDRTDGWVVEATAGDAVRLVPLGTVAAVPEGKSLQFWTKPDGAAGPTSLGLVRAGEAMALPISALPALGARQLFELTLEPAAGSPIGRPTGPILFVGRSVQL